MMKIIQKIPSGIIVLVLVLIFFGRHIFTFDGNFIGGFDVANYFYWHAQFIKEQFFSGSFPLWNPYYYCGHPFLANPQTFILYPSTFLYVFLPLHWAFNLDTILHIYFAAMGAYVFLYSVTQSRSAAIVAAICYSLGGYFMANIFAGHLTMLHTAALLPWIFYFIEKAYKTKRTLFLGICGLVFGLQILGGEPQNNYYTALFITIYFVLRYLQVYNPSNGESFYRFGIYYLLIPAVAFGISAIQVLPSLEFMSLSDRVENTYAFATFMSFPPLNLFTFLVPKPNVEPFLQNANWEFGCYMGIISIVLAGIGGLFSRYRRYALCFGCMLFLALTIMLGHYTPIYRLYYEWVPLFSTFRVPSRCIVILVFSLAVLSGLGVDHLSKSQLTKKEFITIIIGLALLFLCQLGVGLIFEVPLTSKALLLSLAMTTGCLGIFVIGKLVKTTYIVSGLIIALLFVDLYLSCSPQIPKLKRTQFSKTLPYELTFKQDPGFYRVNMPFGETRGMVFNYYGVNGYTPVALNDFFHFIHYMADLPKPLKRRQSLNPDVFSPESVFSSKILGIKYAIVNTSSGYKFLTKGNVMPRAVLVREAIVLPQLNDHLEYIKKPDFDPEKTVLLESAMTKHGIPGSEMGNIPMKNDVVSITNYQAARIELRSDSEADTFLVLSELFYPGWHAFVDGMEAPILRANYLLRAIPLTPGEHEVVFEYKPMSFILGAAISVFTFLCFGCILVIHYRRRSDEP